jgi:hypothetical protein
MKRAIMGIGGAILGALLGAVLGYEFFGFFLARAICRLPVGFNGWGYYYRVVDFLPGEMLALARMSWWSAVTPLLCACLGAALGAAVVAGQGDRIEE